MLWVWLVVIILACIVEWLTEVQLVSIWAALGGIVSFVCYFCGANETVQIIVFFVVTIAAIACTRPLVKKVTKFEKTPTNADMYVGRSGKVINIINESEGLFQVKVEGCVWSAVTEDRNIIPVGNDITVQRIEGVKLIVTPLKQTVQVK